MTNSMNDLEQQLASLSAEKRKLLELLLQKQATVTFSPKAGAPLQRLNETTSLSLQPIPRDGVLPLSFAQQRLWILDQLEPDPATYTIPMTLHLQGQLDGGALDQSFTALIARHEVLRTTFPLIDEQPVQRIAPPNLCLITRIDLHDLPAAERYAEALRLAQSAVQTPFDLAQGPLFRVALFRLAPDDHVLVLTLHHTISDGWSNGIFGRELAILYRAFHLGEVPVLPPLSIQYADYAYWQRAWFQGAVRDQQVAYWRQQLADLPLFELPVDYPRPTTRAFRAARKTLALDRPLYIALKMLGQQTGTTLFMTGLAVFQLLLQRLTGQDDVVVGTPIAGRIRKELEGLIGCFLNTLVLRTNLGGNPSFRELLGRVQTMTLDAYSHQDLPFEQLIEALQPDRDLSRTPLFQIFFNMLNFPHPPTEAAKLRIEELTPTETKAKFDIELYVKERPEGLQFELVYNADLFSEARMDQLLEQLHALVAQIVSQPDAPINRYSLVTPEARELLPNPRAALPPADYELVPVMFERWAKHMPQQQAVCQGSHAWSYHELDERSSSLVQLLRARGLQRGDVVAICGRRSFGLIAGMLAVLRSGGVLLPIAQNLPFERQQLMLREASATYLLHLTDEQAPDQFAPNITLTTIHVDPATARVDAAASLLEIGPLPELTPDAAAYIFFTSGTTGVPKGVLGQHKGLAHFLTWQRTSFEVGPQDRVGQLTGLSFDVVLRDIFLPLVSGATLCLPEHDDIELDDILAWLERAHITLLHTVPSLVQSWLGHAAPGLSLHALRCIFFAGEPLKEPLIRRWRDTFPTAGEIVNLYGPTETTLAKCCYHVQHDTVLGVQPVGWPLPNTQALVLSPTQELCGIGEPGEIVIRTPFRTLGYINPSASDQPRFVPSPFRNDPHDVLYYTGDRGRYRVDGALEILGRLDQQVKVRGVRIDPGEIEVVLSQHPAVREAVVVAREDASGDISLVSYVVPHVGQMPGASTLRDFLVTKLPRSMVPSSVVFLQALPLLPNGKLNRRALPVPEPNQPDPNAVFVAPRTAVEEVLAGIWSNVLGVRPVGIHDDFFDLGGHSLKAALLNSRVREIFRVTLPLRSLFEATTIATLAQLIRAHEARPGQAEKIAQLFKRIQGTSADERQALLEQKRGTQHTHD